MIQLMIHNDTRFLSYVRDYGINNENSSQVISRCKSTGYIDGRVKMESVNGIRDILSQIPQWVSSAQ